MICCINCTDLSLLQFRNQIAVIRCLARQHIVIESLLPVSNRLEQGFFFLIYSRQVNTYPICNSCHFPSFRAKPIEKQMDFYIMILTNEGKNQTGKEEIRVLHCCID